jgi:hypothetical protein
MLRDPKVRAKKVTYFGYPRACRFRKPQIKNRSPDLPLPTKIIFFGFFAKSYLKIGEFLQILATFYEFKSRFEKIW